VPALDCATAIHEAGHAVIALRHRLPIKYVTLRSRTPDSAAHVRFQDYTVVLTTWVDMVLSAAGPLAEDIATGCRDRLYVTEGALADFEDFRESARYTRTALRRGARPDRDRGLSPRSTVRQIAAAAWADTYRLVVADYGAILAVADALLDSRRALTGTEIARVIARAEPAEPPRSAHLAENFWPSWFTGPGWWGPAPRATRPDPTAAPAALEVVKR
jgi:hypothetical protein